MTSLRASIYTQKRKRVAIFVLFDKQRTTKALRVGHAA